MILYTLYLFRHHMLMVLPFALATFYILLRVAIWAEARIKSNAERSKPRWQQRGYRQRQG